MASFHEGYPHYLIVAVVIGVTGNEIPGGGRKGFLINAATRSTENSAVFWDVTPCCCCDSRRFGGTYHLQHQSGKFLVTANVRSSLISSALMMHTMRTSETSLLTRVTRRHFPKDGILPSHRRENLKS
jgi:hypothetical protein